MKLFFQRPAENSGLQRRTMVQAIKSVLLVSIGVCCLLGLSGCSARVTEYKTVDIAMGTVLQITVYAERETTAYGEKLVDSIRDSVLELEEKELSKRIPNSLVGTVNRQAEEEKAGSRADEGNSGNRSEEDNNSKPAGTLLSEELYRELQLVQQVSASSNGAFDITIGEVAELWNLDAVAAGTESFRLPKQQELLRALAYSGYEKIVLEEGRIFLPEGFQLDLGAVGKGIACDRLLLSMEEMPEVKGAIIALGGSILTYGSRPDGSGWNVGIVDPRDTSAYLGRLVLDGQWCVATSGDYERYVEADGVRYHHIIDPATGYPADSGLCSVTILSKNGCLSDALSTACFVLGKEKGLALVEEYDAYAVLVETDGTVILSPGMERFLFFG